MIRPQQVNLAELPADAREYDRRLLQDLYDAFRDQGARLGALESTLRTQPRRVLGSNSVALGGGALPVMVGDTGCTAIGTSALHVNTTGNDNTAVGNSALTTNTTGSNNTALGSGALYANVDGYDNVAVGADALVANTTGGNYNAACGTTALGANTTGDYNTAVGWNAAYGATGVNGNSTGTTNTFIGARTVGAAGSNTNAVVIGADAVGLGSNTSVVGNSSTTVTHLWGDLTLHTPGLSGTQLISFKSLTEVTTIAAAATTDTTIQMPAGAIILAVSLRVTAAITCTTNFNIGDSGSATRFGTNISKAVTTTNAGTVAPYVNAAALAVRITPDTTPSDNTGRVRVTIHYIQVTAPTA